MNEINLVAGKGAKKYDEKKLRLVRIVAVLSLVVATLLSISLFLLNTKFSVAAIKREQTQIITRIASYNTRAAKLSIVNNRVIEISEIKKQSRDFTEFMNVILNMKPDDIFVNSFEIEEKTATISISSTSLLPISDFINELIKYSKKNTSQNPTITKVTIESLSANNKSGEFSMTVILDMP